MSSRGISTQRAIRAARAIRIRAVEQRRTRAKEEKAEIEVLATSFGDDDEDESFCRYCFEEADEENELVSPCQCAGSQKWIHAQCLQNWRSRWPERDRRHTHCPVCMAPFNIRSSRRLNLGAQYIQCSVFYMAILFSANVNVMLWFLLMIPSRRFEPWSVPATMCIGIVNGAICTIATAHHRSRLSPLEIATGSCMMIVNGLSFMFTDPAFPVSLFFVCTVSFLITSAMVLRPYRKRVCARAIRGGGGQSSVRRVVSPS